MLHPFTEGHNKVMARRSLYSDSIVGQVAGSDMSKAGSVRGEGRTASQAGGDVDHELREGLIPQYIDEQRSHLNSIIIAPKRGVELTAICDERRALRDTKRKMKSNACVSQSILISFGREIQPAFEALPIEVQDELYLKLMQKIADEANTDVSGVVAHRDETAPHAHGQLIGYSRDGTPLTKIMNRQFRRDMQDWMVEIFQPHLPEIERGVRKSVRIAQGDDASKTIHKSVGELHGSLLPQIEETKAELARLKEEQATIEGRIAKLREKEALTEKQARNLEAYERRLKAREDAVGALEAETTRLHRIAEEGAQRAGERASKAIQEEIEAQITPRAVVLKPPTVKRDGDPAPQKPPERPYRALVAKLLTDARERIQAALQASPEAHDVRAAISQLERVKERETRAMVERRRELERTARQVEENKQQGNKLLSGEARLAQWHSFVEVMKDKVRYVFGEAGYQRLADVVNEEWKNHPDNLTKPPHQPAPPKPSGSSGPSGP